MEKLFERTYGDYLQFQGAIEHFADDLCGELKTNISEDNVIIMKDLDNIFESEWILENGTVYKISIYLLETEDLESDEVEYEWNCSACLI